MPRPFSGPGRSGAFAALALLLLFGVRCAPRTPRSYGPAGPEDVRLSLAAWEQAVARADSMAAGGLLYEARMIQGLLQIPGTLAVRQAPGVLEATLAGPFGNAVARYTNGALAGEGIRPLRAEPEDLRSLLAGVWRKGTPRVTGFRGDEALLTWDAPEAAEAVFDVVAARLRSLRVTAPGGTLAATYSGGFAPWPERVEIEDVRSGNKLRLTLVGREADHAALPPPPS